MSIINNICEHGQLQRKCEVCELKAEIARLRSVCRMASGEITKDLRNAEIDGITRKQLMLLASDLADAGKEPSDVV